MEGDDHPHPLSAVELVASRAEWAAEFETLARQLEAALGPLALRIDHVGSTSVPGLAAKDVIDVQVIVESFAPEIDAALTRAGLTAPFGAERLRDHVPKGSTWPEERWEKLLYVAASGRAAHVHVRLTGSPNERYALLFRDYLRADETARRAWEAVKRRVAAEAPDRAAYAEAKDPLCDELMVGAERWAAASGWSVGPG